MSNELENFIKNNRDEFDSEEMNYRWNEIESGFIHKGSKIRSVGRYWWAAAAGVIIILISGVIFFNNESKGPAVAYQQPTELPSKELDGDVDPAYITLMDDFVIQINDKQKELNQNQKRQPALYNQFLKDNNKLDSSYNYLKSQLKANPNKEILLDAMVQNLQLKIEILNRQLQIIKQSKLKKTNNENKSI